METTVPQQTFSGITGGGELSLYQYFMASPLFADFADFNSPERRMFLSEYSGMSTNLKNFLASTETATDISSIGISYQLDDNQVSKIAGAIRDLVAGKVFIKDFPVVLSSKLGIDDVKAGEIVNQIVAKSFGPIIEDVKRVQRNKFPDKIQQLQKESRPSDGLTQPSARPIEARPPTPAQSLQQSQNKPQPNQPSVPPIRPPAPTPPPAPAPEPKLAPPPPIPPEIGAAPQVAPSRPPVTDIQPAKPSFKIPDLGQPITKENGEKRGEVAQKSLEAELEKVANVIDLRSQSKE